VGLRTAQTALLKKQPLVPSSVVFWELLLLLLVLPIAKPLQPRLNALKLV